MTLGPLATRTETNQSPQVIGNPSRRFLASGQRIVPAPFPMVAAFFRRSPRCASVHVAIVLTAHNRPVTVPGVARHLWSRVAMGTALPALGFPPRRGGERWLTHCADTGKAAIYVGVSVCGDSRQTDPPSSLQLDRASSTRVVPSKCKKPVAPQQRGGFWFKKCSRARRR